MSRRTITTLVDLFLFFHAYKLNAGVSYIGKRISSSRIQDFSTDQHTAMIGTVYPSKTNAKNHQVTNKFTKKSGIGKIEIYHCKYCNFREPYANKIEDHYVTYHHKEIEKILGANLIRKIDLLRINGDLSFEWEGRDQRPSDDNVCEGVIFLNATHNN